MERTRQIDSTIQIVTPENIAFEYRVAGPFRRLPAFIIDMGIRTLVLVLLMFVVQFLGFFAGAGLSLAVLMVCQFVLEWFYGGFFEAFMNGQTPGKWMMGLRVLTIDGQPISGLQAVMRNILRAVDTMPWISLQAFGFDLPVYMVPVFTMGLVTMAMNQRFQRLGDLVCGTMVVIEERTWLRGVAKLEDPRVGQLAAIIPPNFQMSRSFTQSLALYADRRERLPVGRRREVARHLAEPLLEQFGLPKDTSYDLLLCAMYYRVFVAGGEGGENPSGFGPISNQASGHAASPTANPTAAPPIREGLQSVSGGDSSGPTYVAPPSATHPPQPGERLS